MMTPEKFVGGRKSGKTLRAILWMLQQWPHGVIVEPTAQRAKHAMYMAADLAGQAPKTFIDNVICPTPFMGKGLPPNIRYLLDDTQDFAPHALDTVLSTGKVVAITCLP